MRDLDADFKRYFPKCGFALRDFQKKAISNVLDSGNTLCIMPTGGGKSVVYWMAAAEEGGIALVISPLTALIAEQAGKLEEQGFDVLALHGEIGAEKQARLLTEVARGARTPQFIFLSPEKIATDGFLEHCLSRRRGDIRLVVVDECHCVSQWGTSFRPFYMRIPDFLDSLFGPEAWARVLALTATLNPKELADICASFRIGRGDVLREELLMRSEIRLHVRQFADEDEKTAKFWEILRTHAGERTLVYVYRKYKKRGVEDLCRAAAERGYRAEYFHGDLSSADRMAIVERFKAGETTLVFATNAFGMGIDIPDIRVVIHFMLPESVEQYYQEVGRAARDGRAANAYLLYTAKNIEVKRRYFIDGSFPSEELLEAAFAKRTHGRTGLQTLAYFDDEEVQQCLPYYLRAGAMEIVCKGFSGLGTLYGITDPQLQRYFDSTGTKGFITTLRKNPGLEAAELSRLVYGALAGGTALTRRPLERWLIVQVKAADLRGGAMEAILADIAEKRAYKHGLLDCFVGLLESFEDSSRLNQEIACYLGADKHQLNRIHRAADGTCVRSKSEVIIANLLNQYRIKYQYEEKLYYGTEGRWIEPDFTLYLDGGRRLYWEHVGMLGQEEYDAGWLRKLEIYEAHFPGQLLKTYESGALSGDAEKLIRDLL